MLSVSSQRLVPGRPIGRVAQVHGWVTDLSLFEMQPASAWLAEVGAFSSAGLRKRGAAVSQGGARNHQLWGQCSAAFSPLLRNTFLSPSHQLLFLKKNEVSFIFKTKPLGKCITVLKQQTGYIIK